MSTHNETPHTPTPRKAVVIRLQDENGMIYRWSIRWIACVCWIQPDGPLSKTRHVSGWEYTSHDGVRHFQDGNWLAVVPRVKLTAENYGLTLCSELS